MWQLKEQEVNCDFDVYAGGPKAKGPSDAGAFAWFR
jgi:hypothetical protein